MNKQAQHTEGPWKVGDSEKNNHRGIYSDEYIICTICLMGAERRKNKQRGRNTEDANARLIADAPETAAERDRLKASNAELLKALVELSEDFGWPLYDNDMGSESCLYCRGTGPNHKNDCLMLRIKRLIAKARTDAPERTEP